MALQNSLTLLLFDKVTIKMKLLLLFALFGLSLSANVIDPSDCTAYPCLIFDEEFDTLDHDIWEHELTMSGGGNWEFQAYLNNRSVSYVRDSTLFIKPGLVDDWQGDGFVSSGTINLWGMNGRGDVCTANSYWGCERTGDATNLLNPIMSARLRTLYDFSVRYATVEVRAKMPSGQWLWPAVWMLPRYFPYGSWPASGEIDIIESRGNPALNDTYRPANNQAGTTLHWGPYFHLNSFQKTNHEAILPAGQTFADDFHVWRMEWTDSNMLFYLDGTLMLTVDPVTSFWDFGEFANSVDIDNPWVGGGKMTPFDQPFYFVLNVAVGGTNGFFPDMGENKPWLNISPNAFLDFYNARDTWLPTWQHGEGKISENAALQVDYIKVWKESAL